MYRKLQLLLVGIGLFIPFPAYTNSEIDARLNFRHISVNDGLSQNSVTSFIQNKDGIMMIATYDGINFFDGYSIESIRYSYDKPDGLFNNRIVCMTPSPEGKIWMGLDGGIALYDPTLDIYHNYTDSLSRLRSYWVRSVCLDSENCLWVGTGEDLVRGVPCPDDKYSFSALPGFFAATVYTIKCDNAGNTWVGTSKGLFVFHKNEDGTFKYEDITAFSDRNIYDVLFDRVGNCWVATSDGVEIRYENEEEYRKLFLPDFYNEKVHCFQEDEKGNVWVGTGGRGLYRVTLKGRDIFEIVHYTSSDIFGRLADDTIQVLYIDHSNVLWVGTRNGLNYADLSPPRIHTFKSIITPTENGIYSGGYVSTLFADSNHKLWISLHGEGLFVYELLSRKLVNVSGQITSSAIACVLETSEGEIWLAAQESVYRIRQGDNNYHAEKVWLGPVTAEAWKHYKYYTDMCEDVYGNIWISTIQGLIRYNPEKEEHVSFFKIDGLASDSPFCLLSDPENQTIWIGSSDQGLTRVIYNRKGITSTEVLRKSGTRFTLSHDQVWSMIKGQDGVIWVGTDGGLNRIKMEKDRILSAERVIAPYVKEAKIEAMGEDVQGNLWLNSSQGLYSYNPFDNTVRRYTHDDGLQSNSCTGAITAIDGWVFVGGINGINYFNPELFSNNKYTGKPVFSRLKIFNTIIEPRQKYGGRSLLTRGLNSSEIIRLGYQQNNFVLEFTSDHYAAPGKNMFKYMLVGYDNDWIEVGSDKRYASYENLPSGTYIFRLLSSNNDGVWSNEIREMVFVIQSPPWNRWWAYIGYSMIVGTIVFFIVSYLLSRQRWREKLFRQEMEQLKTEEMNEMKLNFYTNITHELRTPLALISAPLEDLRKRYTDDEYSFFRIKLIDKNTRKLLQLINQLLDIRRVSAHEMPLTIALHDVHNTVKQIVDSFYHLSSQTGIYLRFTPPEINSKGWFDIEKIEKVLHNLISNAFKFTPRDGSIEVKLWTENMDEQEYVFVSVSDSGVGIPLEEQSKIFDMFYHGTPLSGQSSGVGLSFTKALVELHGGKIKVESESGKGSVFTVSFRTDKSYYRQEYIVKEELVEYMEEYEEDSIVPVNNLSPESGYKCKKYTVLIVEDNSDMRSYICDCLKNDFNLLTACDGMEGLEIARKKRPDLVITDMMMPHMSGPEFIREMKSDPIINYIPIIVHSIKSDKESIREAFMSGAQEYIVKPFEASNLILRIGNQLNSRTSFARKVKNEQIIEPSDVYMPSPEEELLNKIHTIMEENMSNASFGVDQLALNLGMSRTKLYRCIKALSIGKNAVEIVRDIRMKRAAQLLATGQLRVTEVMYEVGITNHTRFNRYFQELHGMTPKEYIDKYYRKKRVE